jgi:hypothetical protein
MRWFGYAIDPEAGGTTADDVADDSGVIPAPTVFLPVTTAQVDPGTTNQERNDEVRGRRGNSAPRSFAAAPSMTFGARAYPALTRPLLRRALGGGISSSGTAPAAVQSTIVPAQANPLPTLIGTLVREEQTDRMTGLAIDELEFNFPADEEGSVEVTAKGLYHEVDPTGDLTLPAVSGLDDFEDTFQLRDATAFLGDDAVEIDCLAGFGFTYNNNLYDDLRSTHCAGQNLVDDVIDDVSHRLWYPARHKIGPQAVTGRIDFGDVRPDRELRRILAHAEKLVFEVAAGPLGTTPEADEMMRIIFYKQVITGGGAEPLQRDGDQVSSYEFTGYIDEAVSKDVEAVFVGETAVT